MVYNRRALVMKQVSPGMPGEARLNSSVLATIRWPSVNNPKTIGDLPLATWRTWLRGEPGLHWRHPGPQLPGT